MDNNEMNTQRGAFAFYASFYNTIKKLPERARLPMYEAIAEFAFNMVEPDFSQEQDSLLLDIAWGPIRGVLHANYIKWLNGNKGGKPKNGNTKDKPPRNQAETNPEPTQNQTETNPIQDIGNKEIGNKEYRKIGSMNNGNKGIRNNPPGGSPSSPPPLPPYIPSSFDIVVEYSYNLAEDNKLNM